MNNTFSLEQISKTGSLDSILITRHYKLDLRARFMEIKSPNPKLKQSELAKELRCSSSTLQRYRQDINMLSPYRILPNSHKRKQKISNREHDLDRPQLTSDDLAEPDTNTESIVKRTSNKRNKNSLKGGSIY